MKKGSNFSFDTSFFVFVGARKTSASRLEEKVPLSLPLSSLSQCFGAKATCACRGLEPDIHKRITRILSLSVCLSPLTFFCLFLFFLSFNSSSL